MMNGLTSSRCEPIIDRLLARPTTQIIGRLLEPTRRRITRSVEKKDETSRAVVSKLQNRRRSRSYRWRGGCPSMAAYKLPRASHLPGCLLAVLRASIANTRTSVALQSFQIADRDREKRTGVGKSPIDGEGKERGRQLWRGV